MTEKKLPPKTLAKVSDVRSSGVAEYGTATTYRYTKLTRGNGDVDGVYETVPEMLARLEAAEGWICISVVPDEQHTWITCYLRREAAGAPRVLDLGTGEVLVGHGSHEGVPSLAFKRVAHGGRVGSFTDDAELLAKIVAGPEFVLRVHDEAAARGLLTLVGRLVASFGATVENQK